jgi:hypothetical protein
MNVIRLLSSLAVLLGISVGARASTADLDAEAYRCGDGRDYSVLRHHWGGYGPGSWYLVAICSPGVLSQESYPARSFPLRKAHPDIAKCMDEDTPAIQACYKELVSLNGEKGVGFPPLRHGRAAEAGLGLFGDQDIPAEP